jgi:hypothetical protein
MGKKRNTCKVSVEKPEGNKPLGRPRCRWEDERTRKGFSGFMRLKTGSSGRLFRFY